MSLDVFGQPPSHASAQRLFRYLARSAFPTGPTSICIMTSRGCFSLTTRYVLVFICLFSQGISAASYGLAPRGWILYPVLLLTVLQYITEPCIQGLMATLVDADRQGSLQVNEQVSVPSRPTGGMYHTELCSTVHRFLFSSGLAVYEQQQRLGVGS